MSSATTAAQRELEAPLFTVVESKGLLSVFLGTSKYGLLDVIGRRRRHMTLNAITNNHTVAALLMTSRSTYWLDSYKPGRCSFDCAPDKAFR